MSLSEKFAQIKKDVRYEFHDSTVLEIVMNFGNKTIAVNVVFGKKCEKDEKSYIGRFIFMNVKYFSSSLPFDIDEYSSTITHFFASEDGDIFELQLMYGSQICFTCSDFEYSESVIDEA